MSAGAVADALQHGLDHLAAFLRDATLSKSEAQLLRDALALLAYPDPTAAPMAYLLQDAHRAHVADVVNAAVLQHSLALLVQKEQAGQELDIEPGGALGRALLPGALPCPRLRLKSGGSYPSKLHRDPLHIVLRCLSAPCLVFLWSLCARTPLQLETWPVALQNSALAVSGPLLQHSG